MAKTGTMTRVKQGLTAERREVFLRTYIQTGGSFTAACRAASPHLSPDTLPAPGYQSFRQWLQTDREFAEAFEAANAEIDDQIISAMVERGIHGVQVGVYQKGARVFEPVTDDDGQIVTDDKGKPKMIPASIRRADSSLLLKLASARMPDRFGDKRTVDVRHSLSGNPAGHWQISSADLAVLSTDDRRDLVRILGKVRSHRHDMAQIEHHPEPEAIDADFTEVDPNEPETMIDGDGEEMPAW